MPDVVNLQVLPTWGVFVEQGRFDAMTARLASARNRRRTMRGLLAGPAALFALPAADDARSRRKRKRTKQRCGRLQARCQSNKECCPGKTSRICASNDKDVQCRGGGAVCCLPLDAFGCNDNCDCCGGNTGCNDAGQCRILF